MENMRDIFTQTACFGPVLTLGAFLFGAWVHKKTQNTLANPMVIAMIIVMAFLWCFQIDYSDYQKSADVITYFLTPATVCLAIPLYEKLSLLAENLRAILLSVLAGVAVNLASILVLCRLFGLTHEHYVTMMPKSVTTPIGMGMSEELGGYVTLTVACIVITGNFGFMAAGKIFDLFGITNPVARGLALGNAAHAIGTVRALQYGLTEGAMGGLAIALAGLMTVALAPVFAGLL